MSAAEQWLAANARQCLRFDALLSAEACAKMASEYPLRCAGCEALAGLPAVSPAAPAVRGQRTRMAPSVARKKAQRGGVKRAETVAQRRADAEPSPEPHLEDELTVVFAGEDAQVVRRFAAKSEESGGELWSDIATVLGLFLDGELVFKVKRGRKR